MIYWYTGQPGHGKTLHAIARALDFKAQGRRVFACNIRDFDHEKTGIEKMTPEQFRDWMTFLPDGAVALVDEAYEHDMLPKRAPGAKVPAHVEQLAKHRHRGLDFIFVCQSPDKQCDPFTHDLIERHIHVRRRFGTSFVHLREFDKYERNPEKAQPLLLKRTTLPKRVFGLYKSTELDTTERRIPWYYFVFGLGVPFALFMMYYTFGNMGERLGGGSTPAPVAATPAAPTEANADGGKGRKERTVESYVNDFMPRIPSQPWSAPAYDDLKVSSEPPRIFCALSGAGTDANGEFKRAGCTCITEQGTRYMLDVVLCRSVALNGQYEPFYDEADSRVVDGRTMQDHAREDQRRINEGTNEARGVGDDQAQVASYGRMRNKEAPAYTFSGAM